MRLLLHPLYLLALFLLLVNDHYLKAAYGNWITGKLSDFAGLFAFAVFVELARRSFKATPPSSGRWWGIFTAGIFFAWFKSPLSEQALLTVSELTGNTFSRVVDYTDLWALSMLYPAALFVRYAPRATALLPRPALAAVLPLCLFAFIATSDDGDYGPITGCCELGYVTDTVGSGRVYFPSAFTPDGDGINDTFRIYLDSNVVRIDSFIMYGYYDTLPVYRAYDVTDPESIAFDGSTLDSLPPQTFFYQFIATSRDSVSRFFYADVCALPCDRPTLLNRPPSADSCVYPRQFVAGRGWDFTLPSGEELECYNE